MEEKKSASGFFMPDIGLGTWGMGSLSTSYNPDYNDEADIKAIHHALKRGVTHFDTAEIYSGGQSEEILGKALQGKKRSSYDIATKVAPVNQTEKGVLKSCENSLKRLGIDYIDLYYLHMPSNEVPLEETARGLRKLKSDGLIKYYGVCNFKTETLKKLQDLLDEPISVNQVHYSLIFREPEKDGLLNHCANVGTIITAWRPLMWNYPGRDNQAPGSAWENGVYPILDNISKKFGVTNIQTALSWLISQNNVTTLVKSSNTKHLDEIIGSVGWKMPIENIEELRTDFPEQRFVSDAVPLK